MREVHCTDLAGQPVDAAEWLIVVTPVEQLHLVCVAPTCEDNILVLLAELTGIEQAGEVGYFESIPIYRIVEGSLPGVPLLQLVGLPVRSSKETTSLTAVLESDVIDAVASIDLRAKDIVDRFLLPQVPNC